MRRNCPVANTVRVTALTLVARVEWGLVTRRVSTVASVSGGL